MEERLARHDGRLAQRGEAEQMLEPADREGGPVIGPRLSVTNSGCRSSCNEIQVIVIFDKQLSSMTICPREKLSIERLGLKLSEMPRTGRGTAWGSHVRIPPGMSG